MKECAHFLSACRFLPEADRNFLQRARFVTVDDDAEGQNELDVECADEDEVVHTQAVVTSRSPEVNRKVCPVIVNVSAVQVQSAPYVWLWHGSWQGVPCHRHRLRWR